VSLFGTAEYPGRGLAIGRDADGVPFFAYWLTGRSPASQARELVVHDREVIVRDTSGGRPDDLRHYTAAIRGDDWVVVGNGTQVSELVAAHGREQQNGSGSVSFDLQLAVRDITYEPDPPIRTPRITASATITGTELTDAVVASARAQSTDPDRTDHPSLYAAQLPPASALTTTTYQGTAEDVVTNGRPATVAVPISWSAISDAVWTGLTPTLRVAMVTVRLDQDTFAGAVARSR
jgi:IMP cyclohydrolase